MITELFPTQPRNVALGISYEITSASNIDIGRNLITNKVVDVLDSLSNNIGNENVAIRNLAEAPHTQHGIILENNFSILDSN